MIVKGTGGSFKMSDGQRVHVGGRHGMMHDPTGKKYRSCTVLFGPFERTGKEKDPKEVTRAERQ